MHLNIIIPIQDSTNLIKKGYRFVIFDGPGGPQKDRVRLKLNTRSHDGSESSRNELWTDAGIGRWANDKKGRACSRDCIDRNTMIVIE